MATVTLKEKELPIHFGIGTLRRFSAEAKIPIS